MLSGLPLLPATDRANRLLLSGVLLWAALIFSLRLPLPLLEPEETRYAEIPREMLAADHWLVPVFQGESYLDKPPLLYWLVMASYRLFGDHVWSGRLVTVLSAWLTVVVVYLWGQRIYDERSGIVAALVLTLFGDFVYRAPMLTMNGPLALLVALGLYLGHVAGLGAKFDRRAWLLAGLATAAGVLMKGPVAIVLVVGPLVALRWFDERRGLSPSNRILRCAATWSAGTSPAARQSRSSPGMFDWLGFAAVVLAVSGPWFAWMAWTEPTFVDYFFLKHHVERFVTPFDHVKPFWFYVPQILLGIFPWSLLLVARIRRLWSAPESRFLLVAGIGGLIFFSLAGSKRPVYLVPIYAPLAIATAGLLRTEFRRAFVPIAMAMATLLLVGTTCWLPAYSELHSTPAAVGRQPGEGSKSSLPVAG
jgi:4-amino-4-deoxy-L-arabinose transferase-like glycosyltransferase